MSEEAEKQTGGRGRESTDATTDAAAAPAEGEPQKRSRRRTVSAGQHRRTGAPLRQRLTKLVSASSGSHRRRNEHPQPSDHLSTANAEEGPHVAYRHGTARHAS